MTTSVTSRFEVTGIPVATRERNDPPLSVLHVAHFFSTSYWKKHVHVHWLAQTVISNSASISQLTAHSTPISKRTGIKIVQYGHTWRIPHTPQNGTRRYRTVWYYPVQHHSVLVVIHILIQVQTATRRICLLSDQLIALMGFRRPLTTVFPKKRRLV